MLRTQKFRPNTRRCPLNIVHDLKLTLFISLSLLWFNAAQAKSDYLREVEQQVEAAAIEFLVRQHPNTEIDLVLNPINPALALQPCSEPLDIRFPYASDQRLTARVNCSGTRPWSIFITARFTLWQQVVMAAEPLARGTRISVSQLKLGRAQTRGSGEDIYTRTDQVAGQRTKRAIGASQPVRASDLEPALLVRRGDLVILETSRGGVDIRVKAIALENGRKGDQIQVQNQQSKRELIAEVIDSGRVKIF